MTIICLYYLLQYIWFSYYLNYELFPSPPALERRLGRTQQGCLLLPVRFEDQRGRQTVYHLVSQQQPIIDNLKIDRSRQVCSLPHRKVPVSLRHEGQQNPRHRAVALLFVKLIEGIVIKLIYKEEWTILIHNNFIFKHKIIISLVQRTSFLIFLLLLFMCMFLYF